MDISNQENMVSSRKLLTVCMTARNDSYCGNFLYRLETCLNHMARNLKSLRLNDSVEIMITDWNSEIRLGDVLKLSSEAGRLCRFIHVPQDVARRHNPENREFNTSLSANVSLRRAAGKYIMFMPCDIVFPETGFKNLISLLLGEIEVPFDTRKSLLLICRKFIPWQFIIQEPGIEDLEKYLIYNAWRCADPPYIPGLNAHMGAIIMSQALWRETRGLDQALTKWGWSDIELGLRVNQIAQTICLNHFGIHSYEMDSKPQARIDNLSDKNPTIVNRGIPVNDENWGLGDVDLEYYGAPGTKQASNGLGSEPKSKYNAIKNLAQVPLIPNLIHHFKPKILASQEWPAIYSLAYCMHYLKPRYYVDFSIFKGPVAITVPFIDPSIHYIGISECASPTSGAELCSTLEYFRDKLKFRGHFHLISGDIQTALQRLNSAIKIAPAYDLFYFVPDLLPDAIEQQIEAMLGCLSRNGAIVYHSADDLIFREAADSVQELSANSISIKSFRYRTGILLNVSDAESYTDKQTDSREESVVNEIFESWRVN